MNFLKYHKAVFFDFDGVIINSENIYCDLMLEYNKSRNLNISKDYYIQNLLGKTKTEITEILKEKYKDSFKETNYWEGLLRYRNEFFENIHLSTKEGYIDLFNYLKKHNYYIGIVSSNTKEFIEKVLKKTNINIQDFNIVVTRENVQRVKPHNDLYKYAIDKSNLNSNNIFAIEDSKIGIKSALSSGVNTIHVQDLDIVPNKTISKCYASVESLNEVIKILERTD